MFSLKVESEDGFCKMKLYPADPEFSIGGYGRDDVLVFKGAPVSLSAIQKMLEKEFGEVLVNIKENSIEIEMQRMDCSLVIEDVAIAIREMMENAAKDLDQIEEIIKESLKKYMRRVGGSNGN
ncbi:MAG: hypothetical protein H0Z19_07010 [Archaeoglobus sp.]|uniref:hypothetical protein n=1 Tax=Archaeoglobus sp. TaxID=1872626 RepID=UPI001D4ACFA4|nr:hypothetical protein [Archaeoglobus sp.]MBO8180214.1 hypothetical protein [Archaeoglobus sp.]